MNTSKKRWWLIGGGLALPVLGLVLLCVLAAHMAGLAQAQAAAAQNVCPAPGAAGGEGGVDTTQVAQQVRQVLAGTPTDIRVEGLSEPEEQIPNAKIIVATGTQLGVGARGQIVALATALQESRLRNITYGDRDSLGLFQQRPSQGWGTPQQIQDPVYASTKFYNALKSVDGWESMPVTVAAQKVQKSAFPDAYAKHEPLATALQQAIAPHLGTAPGAGTVPAGNAGTGGGGMSELTEAWMAGFGGNCPGSAQQSDYGDIPEGQVPDGYRIPATAPPTVQNAIRWAMGQLGTPYQWGGTCTDPHGPDPSKRCDCSSLMQRAYGVAGISLTRTTYTQIRDGRAVPASQIQPGDLVFTRGSAARPEHVAMAIGDGLVIEAPRTGRNVRIVPLADHGTVLAVRRVT